MRRAPAEKQHGTQKDESKNGESEPLAKTDRWIFFMMNLHG
jgi:hypothetical protein